MKFVNETNWDTRQFKAFVRAVAKFESLTPEDIKKLHVTLKYGRHSDSRRDNEARGWGWYNRWDFRLAVVKDAVLDKPELARTIAIMLNYNQGVRSRAIRHDSSFYGSGSRDKWLWADKLPLTMRQEKPQEKPGKRYVVAKKLEHCLKQIVLWEKKAKLAETKLRRWKAKLRYYERTLLVPAPAPAAEKSLDLGQGSGNEGMEGNEAPTKGATV